MAEAEKKMYHVVVEKMCPCALRKKMPQIKSFETREAAGKTAEIWAHELNETFCREHEFNVIEVDDNYVISVE